MENSETKEGGFVREEPSLTLRTRIFLALIPDHGSREQLVRVTRSRIPGKPDRWIHPDDLHMTLLFGGEQPQTRHPEWKEAVEIAAVALFPAAERHVERIGRISWDPKRQLLALEFPPEAQFWREADRVSRSLSGRLMGQAPFRTLWPHLTLSRRALLKKESVLAIGMTSKAILDETPLKWSCVRLLESDPGNPVQGPRYRTLFERPLAR